MNHIQDLPIKYTDKGFDTYPLWIYVFLFLRQNYSMKYKNQGLINLIRADREGTARHGEKTMCRASTVCGP